MHGVVIAVDIGAVTSFHEGHSYGDRLSGWAMLLTNCYRALWSGDRSGRLEALVKQDPTLSLETGRNADRDACVLLALPRVVPALHACRGESQRPTGCWSGWLSNRYAYILWIQSSAQSKQC